MDAKALAKSKRAHSQYHSKKHRPNQASKAPSTSTGPSGGKKQSGTQVGEKSTQSRDSSSLPTNWDRYEEEHDSGSEDPSQTSNTKQATDVILPKSKGADYAYLISEAKSQAQIGYSTESFPSFDDFINDFNQGLGPLLSIRGQSILSWAADDGFIVEDKATTNHEASFFSLNLHALAEQLEKANLAQRLFIESDLLPPEPCAEESKTKCQDEASGKFSDALTSFNTTIRLSDSSTLASHYFTASSIKGLQLAHQDTDKVQEFSESVPSASMNSRAELGGIVANANEKNSRFEAAAAEAELDVLLDSFSETKFFESSGFIEKSSYRSQVLQDTSTSKPEEISSINSMYTQHLKGPDLPISAIMAVNLDESIDDLLNETSSLSNQKVGLESTQLRAAPFDMQSSTSSQPVSKSKLLDDFDSWLDTI